MSTEKILSLIVGALGASFIYAMDWQREQDERMSKAEKLIERQSVILEMQIKLNEQQMKERMFLTPDFRPRDYERNGDDN